MSMKRILNTLLPALLLCFALSSCDYRQYADAEYPDNLIYQTLAQDGVLMINSAPTVSEYTASPGSAIPFYLDEARGKLVINMGVVQSGIELRPCSVELSYDKSAVNKYIDSGELGSDVVALKESALSFPRHLELEGASVSYQLEISTNAFVSDEYYKKKLLTAVKVSGKGIMPNPDLQTVVILIDPAFLLK